MFAELLRTLRRPLSWVLILLFISLWLLQRILLMAPATVSVEEYTLNWRRTYIDTAIEQTPRLHLMAGVSEYGIFNTVEVSPRTEENSVDSVMGQYLAEMRRRADTTADANVASAIREHVKPLLEMTYVDQARPTKTQYYLAFERVDLPVMYASYYLLHGRDSLAYLVKDSGSQRSNSTFAHWRSKPLEFKYDKENHMALLHISDRMYNLIHYGRTVCMIILFSLGILFFIGLPSQILWDISKGKAFSAANTKRLLLVLCAVLFISIANLGVDLLHWLMIRPYLTEEFSYTIFPDLVSQERFLLYALIVFLIMKAFKRGFELQHEQNLTI